MTGLGSSCGACKFLRRKCTPDCVFTPYFSYNRAAEHFAAVHKVFGASNASKILLNLPMHERSEAAMSISYEALARMRDPVYGCVAQIFALQQQAASLQEEIDLLAHQMANGAFDADTYASFQGIDNMNNVLQPSFQCSNDLSIGDYLSEKTPGITEYYLNQQTPQFKCMESTSANQAFCTEMDNLLPPLYNWEDQVSHSCSDSAERLFMGADQELFLHYQLMENGSTTLI